MVYLTLRASKEAER